MRRNLSHLPFELFNVILSFLILNPFFVVSSYPWLKAIAADESTSSEKKPSDTDLALAILNKWNSTIDFKNRQECKDALAKQSECSLQSSVPHLDSFINQCEIIGKALNCDEILAENPNEREFFTNCKPELFCQDILRPQNTTFEELSDQILPTLEVLVQMSINLDVKLPDKIITVKELHEKQRKFFEDFLFFLADTIDKVEQTPNRVTNTAENLKNQLKKLVNKYSIENLPGFLENVGEKNLRKYYCLNARGKDEFWTNLIYKVATAGKAKDVAKDIYRKALDLAPDKPPLFPDPKGQVLDRINEMQEKEKKIKELTAKGQSKEKQTTENDIPKKKKSKKSKETNLYVEQLKNAYLNWSPFSKNSNKKFYTLTLEANANKKGTSLLYGFAELRKANKLLDKDLASSLFHYQVDLALNSINETLIRLSQDQVKKMAIKGIKISFSNFYRNMKILSDSELPREIEDEIHTAFLNSQNKFNEVVKTLKLAKDAKTDKWFVWTFGKSPDDASARAEFAKKERNRKEIKRGSDPKYLKRYTAGAKEVIEISKDLAEFGEKRSISISKIKNRAEVKKARIVNTEQNGQKPNLAALFEPDSKSPKFKALDFIRKSLDDMKKTKFLLKEYFQLSELPGDEEIKALRELTEKINKYNPDPLATGERVIASLGKAKFGGISADMRGMGAMNSAETHKAIVSAMKEAQTNDTNDIIKFKILEKVRQAEQNLTHNVFNVRKSSLTNIAESVFGKNNIHTVCSGDDCTIEFLGKVSETQKKEFVETLGRSHGDQFRLSIVQEGIADSHSVSILKSDGEIIEEYFRDFLNETIGFKKYDDALFAVNMLTKTPGSGSVTLTVGSRENFKINQEDLKVILEAFNKAAAKKGYTAVEVSK